MRAMIIAVVWAALLGPAHAVIPVKDTRPDGPVVYPKGFKPPRAQNGHGDARRAVPSETVKVRKD